MKEAAKNGNTILFATVIAALFSLLTCGTLSDAALITNSGATSAIPGLGLSLPVAPFLFAAPFLLLALQTYFTVNLYRYELLIAELPALFPDGTPLRLKAYPWLFNSLLPLDAWEVDESIPLTMVEVCLAFSVAYLLVPFSIWMIWFRILAVHGESDYGTLLALACSIFSDWHFSSSTTYIAISGATAARGGLMDVVFRHLILIAFSIGIAISIQANGGHVKITSSRTLFSVSHRSQIHFGAS